MQFVKPKSFPGMTHNRMTRLLRIFCVLVIQLSSLQTIAQYAKLHDFGSNGNYPDGALFSDGTFLYGMASDGGANNKGTIYKIKPDGTGFSKLLDFNGTGNGSHPYGALISDGTFLYGMTESGGSFGLGVLFKIKTDGTGFAKLLEFNGANGSFPDDGLISDGTFLYGMTTSGGANDLGTIFKIMPNGTGYVKLLDFDGSANGSYPYGSLFSDGTFLYGMTSEGGTDDLGTIFKIMPDGTGFVKLKEFGGGDGSNPYGSLISDGTFLYGMTSVGGVHDDGVIFKIKPDGTAFTSLLDLNGSPHGSNPYGSLISDGTFLYGMASYYGNNDDGTIFKIRTDGTGFIKMLDFNRSTTGSSPYGSLISDGTFLYGMTNSGGNSDLGTLFKIKTDGTGYARLLDFETTGMGPFGSLISDGTFLYGMTSGGGEFDLGNIFKIMPDGTGYTNLHDFAGVEFLDGGGPQGSLFFDGTFLYGMTKIGGAFDQGTIFKIKTDGTGYELLLDFDSNNGEQPLGSLISDGTFLYGMTSQGGNDDGIIFKIKPDGTGFVEISDFNAPQAGYEPHGDLLFDGTFLYGMTKQGGANGLGTVFKLKPDGTGYTNLLAFTGTANGSHPYGSLISDGTFLYGMTNTGGADDIGTIFKIKPDGTGFAKLIDLGGFENNSPQVFGRLNFDGTFLYGLTSEGGNDLRGSLFRMKPDGSGYSDLVSFQGNPATGGYPKGSLLLLGTSLYGMTLSGGTSNWGTLFKYSLSSSATITITTQPSDFIACEGTNATFSAAATGTTNITYQWQFATVSAGPYTDITNGGGYSNATTSTLTVNTTGPFGAGRYRCKINGDFASTVFTNNEGLFINAVPAAPTATNASSCSAASLTLTASGAANGQYRWYNVATGGTPLTGEVNGNYVTPILSSTATYYASINISSCESTRTPAIAAINTVSKPTLVTSNCTTTSATLSGPAGFTTYAWSNGASTQQITVAVAGSYTLIVTSSSGCISPASDPTVFTATFCNQPPAISTASISTVIQGAVSLSLSGILSDPDNNLDLTTLKIFQQPVSGAVASIGPNATLLIDYKNNNFAGEDQVSIEVCDLSGVCTQKTFTILVAGEIVINTGISPNGNGQNDAWIIQYIDAFPDTKENRITIFNRWGDTVFETSNYDNVNRVFRGLNKNGNELPTGTYFYKIEFSSGKKMETGYLSLKR